MVQQDPRRPRGINICKPVASTPWPAPEARGKGKKVIVEEIYPESSFDEGKFYSNLVDDLPIPEDLFSEIDLFSLASSLISQVDNSSSYNLSIIDSSDTGEFYT